MNPNEKIIDGKKFALSNDVLYSEYPTKRGAQQVAAKIRREVPYKGYLATVSQTPGWHIQDSTTGTYKHFWGVYVRDETKKPWKV